MATIPAELVGLIVSAICADAESDSVPGVPPDRTRRRRLAACALVCRHWAARVRPHLFQRVTIRSQADALAFFAFVQCPLAGWAAAGAGSMNVAPCVWWLSVEMQAHGAEKPWAHHVLMHRHLLQNLSSVYVTLSGAPPESDSSMPTMPATPLLPLYDHLPRALPRSLTHCDTMILHGVHTARFTDLLQLAGKTSCWALECYGLRCADARDLADSDARAVPPDLASKSRFLVRKVVTEHCCGVPVWPFLWLMFTTRAPQNLALRRRPAFGCVPYVPPDGLRRLQGFVRCATDAVSGTDEGCTIELVGRWIPPSNVMKIHGKWSLDQQADKNPWKILLDISNVGIVTKIVFGVDVQRPEDRNVPVPIISDEDAMARHPWTALDEHASRLGDDMASFEVVVYTDADHMRQYATTVAQAMPRMSQAGKQSFWCRSEEGGCVDGFVDIDFQWNRAVLRDEASS